MAQGNKPRHSRSTRKPVTIDLEPEDVKDEKAAKADAPAQGSKSDTKASEAGKPEIKATATDKAAGSVDKVTDKPDTGKASEPAAAAKAAASKSEPAGKADAKDNADASGKSAAAGSVPKAGAAVEKTGKMGTEKPDTGAAKKTDADAAVKAAAAASQSPQKSGSGLRTLGVGLISAVVAVALFGGLQYAGVLQVPGGASGGSAADIVTADVEALKQSIASLEQSAGGAAGDVSAALEGRVSALEGAVSNAGSGSEDRLAALESKVESLASQGGDGQAAATSDAALKELSDRVAALEKLLSDQQSSLQDVESSVTSLGQKIAGDEQSQDQTIKAIDDRLAAIEKTLDAPRQDIQVARALAATSLKAAIDRGGPFMAELEAFASVDGDSPAIAQLRTLAAAGVPSRATLLSRFPSVANAMIAAGETGSESGGLFDHLLSSVTSLVQVRPVGEVAGDGVEAIVARMETRLKNGDLQGVLNEWNTLPQAAKDASQGYVKDLQARIEAKKLISGSLTAALPEAVRSGSEQSGGNN